MAEGPGGLPRRGPHAHGPGATSRPRHAGAATKLPVGSFYATRAPWRQRQSTAWLHPKVGSTNETIAKRRPDSEVRVFRSSHPGPAQGPSSPHTQGQPCATRSAGGSQGGDEQLAGGERAPGGCSVPGGGWAPCPGRGRDNGASVRWAPGTAARVPWGDGSCRHTRESGGPRASASLSLGCSQTRCC